MVLCNGNSEAHDRGRSMRGRIIPIIAAVVLAGCDQKTAGPKITELAMMTVKGSCQEDHANKAADYQGFFAVVRVDATGQRHIFGSVTKQFDPSTALDSAQNPNDYQQPSEITLYDDDPGVTEGTVTLHGISNTNTPDGEADKGYPSTCTLEILKSEIRTPSNPN